MRVSRIFSIRSRCLLATVCGCIAVMGMTASAQAEIAGEVSVTNIKFGEVLADGKASKSETVTVKSTGDKPLIVLAIGLNGLNPHFTVKNFSLGDGGCFGAVLATGQSCKFEIIYQPTLDRSTPNLDDTNTIKVTLNTDKTPRDRYISLEGTSLVPRVGLYTDVNSDFGPLALDALSLSKTFRLTNSGTADLTLQPLAFVEEPGTETGTFILDPNSGCNTPGIKLAPGADCNLVIYFKPKTTGSKKSVLNALAVGSSQNGGFEFKGEGIAVPKPPVQPPNDPGIKTVTGSEVATTTTATTPVSVPPAETKDPALSLLVGRKGRSVSSLRVKRGKKVVIPYTVNLAAGLNVQVVNAKKKKVFTLNKKNVSVGSGQLVFASKKLKAGRYKVNVQATVKSQTVKRSLTLIVKR